VNDSGGMQEKGLGKNFCIYKEFEKRASSLTGFSWVPREV